VPLSSATGGRIFAPAEVTQEKDGSLDGTNTSSPEGDERGEGPANETSGPQKGLGISNLALASLALYHVFATVVTHYHRSIGAALYVVGIAIFHRPLRFLLKRYLADNWRLLNEEAEQARARKAPGTTDYRPLVVLVVSAISLALLNYTNNSRDLDHWIQQWGRAYYDGHYTQLFDSLSWVLIRVLGYIVVPWVATLFMPGERFSSYGLSPRGFFKHLWIYGLLFLIIAPSLVMVSYSEPFQKTYPLYKLAGRSYLDLIVWCVGYALQFFALEVFFRGFMIHPLKDSYGANAIFFMALPYCMIHFRKPVAEALGAVLAGMVLGTLSLRTGSIWCGVLIHVSVAWSMDFLALGQRSAFSKMVWANHRSTRLKLIRGGLRNLGRNRL
jgi:membrane protease YdiL (CAAX protease family)